MKQDWRMDPILILLAAVVMFLVVMLVLCAWLLPSNTIAFVTISSLLTGAASAFYAHMPPAPTNTAPNTATTTKTDSTTTSTSAPEK